VVVVLLSACAPAGTSATPSSPRASSVLPSETRSSEAVPSEEPSTPEAPDRGLPASARGPYPVTRVVDGDTIWVRAGGQRVKVRLIGMDTPETVAPNEPVACFGPEASARAEQLLSGTDVYLELDPSQGELDRYGRTLAYVWMPDGVMFNELMIREGFAVEYTYDDPYRYQARFRAAEDAARAEGLGLWSAC
jgi:micrococcal nuclease